MPAPNFVGDFTPAERALLERSFGACQLTLLARGKRRSELALLRWEPALAASGQASPLRRPVGRAFYLLDAPEERVEPVRDVAALKASLPGEFEPALLQTARPTWWQQIGEGLRNPAPWHILAVIALWLLILAFVVWRAVTGHPV